MTIYRYWVAQSAGNWSDPSNWSATRNGVGGATVPIGTGDGQEAFAAIFTPERLGNCTLDSINFLHGGTKWLGSLTVEQGYTGTIDFNSKDLYFSTISIPSSCVLTGYSGRNWTILTLDIQGASGSLRTIQPAATWTIYGGYRCTFTYANIQRVVYVAPLIPGADASAEGINSVDQGDNVNIVFTPDTTTGSSILLDCEMVCSCYLEGELAEVTQEILQFGGEIICSCVFGGEAQTHLVAAPPKNGVIVAQPVVIPGGTFDFSQSTFLKLTVDGTIIDFSSPIFNLKSFSVSYDGKELTFSEICTQGYGTHTFRNEDPVTLEMDLDGNGMKVYFRGKIHNVSPQGENENESVTYTAFGYQNIARKLDLLGSGGLPIDNYTPLNTVGEVVEAVIGNNAVSLAAEGIASTFGSPGPESLTAFLSEFATFENATLIDSIRSLIATEMPAKRIFWDDLQVGWVFPDLLNADVKILNIEEADVEAHSYSINTDNCFTAVKGFLFIESLPTVIEERGIRVLTPAWDPAFEADWTSQRGISLSAAAQFGDAYAKVFREWYVDGSMPNTLDQFFVLALVRYWKNWVWVPIQAVIDQKNGKVKTNVPIVTSGNVHSPGDAVGPRAVVLGYIDADTVPANGGDIPSVRIPETGYVGTAYTSYGIAREKKFICSLPEINGPFLNSQLETYKDAVVQADIPIVGNPLKDFINLQCRVRLTGTSKQTGIDSIDAMLVRYSYAFGKPGRSTLSISTDKATVTRTK